MLSPESFLRTHQRHVTDVIRIALERKGIIGFIEFQDSMTLTDARTLIWENVDHAPSDFQFVLEDGVPVSSRQETSLRIHSFYPCIKIRDCTKTHGSLSPRRLSIVSTLQDTTSSNGSEKVSVWTASGEEFAVWISEEYTFQQLRRDAARYWHLPPTQVALVDGEGCLWPEQAKILSVMTVDELYERKIILENKGGSTQSSTQSIRQHSNRRKEVVRPPSIHACTNPNQELWRIFTFYCVTGDSLDLEYIRAHQFNKLLRDARVLQGGFTPAMADIVYTSETKGKPHSSGKMNYDEFLNALLKIATIRRQNTPISRPLRDAVEEDELFQRIITDHILPLASRWPTHLWDEQTHRLRALEIVAFVTKFLDSLLDIYSFYAKSHCLNSATNIKEFFMSHTDYQRFIADFAISNLQISSLEAAQVFVAACCSTPFHEAFVNDTSCVESSGDTFTAIRRILNSSEGLMLYSPSTIQIGRMCMTFSAFVDALGRMGLTSFAKTTNVKPLQAVKAVFHHLSRSLTRSRLLEILSNHGSTSIHSARFYSSSLSFSNRFLDMWRYDGSPDYLTNENIVESVEKSSPPKLARVQSTGKMEYNNVTGVTPAAPLSPLRRLSSSAARNDERIVQNGVGRGREALDRLVRNAFIRNAVTTGSNHQESTLCVGGKTVNGDEVGSVLPMKESVSRGGSLVSDDLAPLIAPSIDSMVMKEPVQDEVDRYHSNPSQDFNNGICLHPSGSNVLDDDKVLYSNLLLKGGVFKKYGQWGNPHRRFVWCSKELDGIYWRPINKQNSLNKEGIMVSSMIAVLPGNSTRTRYAFMKHLSEEKSLSRCFSLVADDRRLDLEADSEATRDLWMNALTFLMKEHR